LVISHWSLVISHWSLGDLVEKNYTLHDIQKANERLLMSDIYLILLYANRIPPHLAVTVNGRLFTLTTKGATVDGELASLLRLIKKNTIETIFVKLNVPVLFTLDQLHQEIKRYTLAYPRVDVGIATCLNPIRDFCGKVYDADAGNANFIFELLPKLEQKRAVGECFYMNMENYLRQNSFALRTYTMNDIFEGIRNFRVVGA
jgi:hypothetical protein